jgi:hypothetical protein
MTVGDETRKLDGSIGLAQRLQDFSLRLHGTAMIRIPGGKCREQDAVG